jgi:hypothetical protein
MTRRRQTPKPVPLTPTHRRDRRTFWRRCTCGLTCPCVDRLVPATPLPFPPRAATTPHPPARSVEDRSPRLPTLIEYLATVPVPVHFGVAVLRTFPAGPPPSPDPPETSLPRAPAGHSGHAGGSGALGGPGSRPCPGSRAGAALLPIPRAPSIGRAAPRHRPPPHATRRRPTPHAAASTVGLRWSCAAVGPGSGERAGERVGRTGARGLRPGPDGGRRGRLRSFSRRPAMVYHHIDLSRR